MVFSLETSCLNARLGDSEGIGEVIIYRDFQLRFPRLALSKSSYKSRFLSSSVERDQ